MKLNCNLHSEGFKHSTQSQHDNDNQQHPDLSHEPLHVVFFLEDERPQIVEGDVVLYILGKAMIFHIDLRKEERNSMHTMQLTGTASQAHYRLLTNQKRFRFPKSIPGQSSKLYVENH